MCVYDIIKNQHFICVFLSPKTLVGVVSSESSDKFIYEDAVTVALYRYCNSWC